MAGSVEGGRGVVGGVASADDAGAGASDDDAGALEAYLEAACGNAGGGGGGQKEGRAEREGEASEDPPRRITLVICDARASSRRRSTPQDSGGVGREGREGTNRRRRRRFGGARADAHVARAERSRARLGRRATGTARGKSERSSQHPVFPTAPRIVANHFRGNFRLAVRRHTRVFSFHRHTPACSPASEGTPLGREQWIVVAVFIDSRARCTARVSGPSGALDRRGLDRTMSPPLPRADLDALMSVVSRVREVAARLRDASSSDADVQSVATEASLLFLDLKAANREVLESAEETREATAAAKAALDGARLQLQNVLYEKAHIQKEIRANQDFRSAFTDEEIGLCSVDEFQRKAPGENIQSLDEHELMLKRLSHELTERKALCERERELEVRRSPDGSRNGSQNRKT